MFPQKDKQYTEYYLGRDIKQAKLGSLLLLVPTLLFIVNDYSFFGLTPEFWEMTVYRVLFVAVTAIFLVNLNQVKDYRNYYRSEFAWGLFGIIFQLFVNFSRPQGFLFHVTLVVILVFVTCLIIPQTFVNRLFFSLVLTVGELSVILVSAPSLNSASLFSLVFNLFLSLLIGLSASRLIESYRLQSLQARQNLERSEKKYRLLADSLPEIVFEADENLIVSYINEKGPQLLGYSIKEFERFSLLNLLNADDQIRAKQNTTKRFQGEISQGNQYTIVKKDGTTFPAIIFTELVNNENGTRGLRGIIVNTTELTKANNNLKIANEKLSVIGGLTRHDVRNKLMVIRAKNYQLKKKLEEKPELKEYTVDIDAMVDSASKLLDVSTYYERIGTEQLTKQKVDECFDQAVALHSSLKNITVINKCAGLVVMADSLLIQLFYNLIDNSVKHGKVSALKLTFEETPIAIELCYEDDGIGIPLEHKSLLFSGDLSKNGSGYGLKLIKRIIDVYGWQIKETGIQDSGVKFTIVIPKNDRIIEQ